MAKAITSRDNAGYKAMAKLVASAAERKRSGLSVIEGAHLLGAFLDAGHVPERVMLKAAADDADVAGLIARVPAKCVTVLAEPLFRAISGVDSPTGVIAAVRTPPATEAPATAKLVLLLEDIQDPGNVGTLLRSAAAAGAEHVLLSARCAFAWSPKVLRAAMGAHFALNIVEGANLVAYVRAFRGTSIALDGGAQQSLYALDLRGALALAVGNEGSGLSAELRGAATVRATIPMPGRVESLNAATAGSVALFETVRQRQARSR